MNSNDLKELGSRNDDDLSDSPCKYCGDLLPVEEAEYGEIHCHRCRWLLGQVFDPRV
jgi:hypothetical protein